MKELSLNVLDIAENSVKAGAALTEIILAHDTKQHRLAITVKDDGCGMDPEFLARVTDPFSTTRTTRKVGMGIPLFKLAAEMAGGDFSIRSEKGKGTTLTATFDTENIDMAPVGDIAGTIVTLIRCHPETDFRYQRILDDRDFVLDTREIRDVMGDIPLSSYEVTAFVQEFIEENTNELYGGKTVL